MKLITENIPGNLHQAAGYVNNLKMADYVLIMDTDGHTTVVVFRVPDDFDVRAQITRGMS